MFKKGKQYQLTLPYIYYWGCDNYHFIHFHKHSWVSCITRRRNNGNVFFEILYNNGKLTFNKIND